MYILEKYISCLCLC